MKKHLAIMHLPMIEAIFAGHKTIESRFSLHRITPYGQISIGDLVYLKPPGRDLLGQFKVKKVLFFEGMEPADFQKVKQDYQDRIGSGNKTEDQKYWDQKADSRFGTLIFISQVERFITSPVRIRKSDQRGWMVLEN